jgi:hypothetical protein
LHSPIPSLRVVTLAAALVCDCHGAPTPPTRLEKKRVFSGWTIRTLFKDKTRFTEKQYQKKDHNEGPFKNPSMFFIMNRFQ